MAQRGGWRAAPHWGCGECIGLLPARHAGCMESRQHALRERSALTAQALAHICANGMAHWAEELGIHSPVGSELPFRFALPVQCTRHGGGCGSSHCLYAGGAGPNTCNMWGGEDGRDSAESRNDRMAGGAIKIPSAALAVVRELLVEFGHVACAGRASSANFGRLEADSHRLGPILAEGLRPTHGRASPPVELVVRLCGLRSQRLMRWRVAWRFCSATEPYAAAPNRSVGPARTPPNSPSSHQHVLAETDSRPTPSLAVPNPVGRSSHPTFGLRSREDACRGGRAAAWASRAPLGQQPLLGMEAPAAREDVISHNMVSIREPPKVPSLSHPSFGSSSGVWPGVTL